MIETPKKRALNSRLRIMVLISILSLIVISCGGDSGSSSGSGSVSVSAIVGSDYTIAHKPGLFEGAFAAIFGGRAHAINANGTVDQVVAVPSYQGHHDGTLRGMVKTANIAGDGSFSLSLDRSYEWVLLLVDSQAADLSDKVVSYVSAGINDDDSLVAFSGGSLQSNLDLGVLAQASNEAQGRYDAAAFNLTLDQIKAAARSDDGYKHIINAYLNYNPNTGVFYTIQPIFGWSAGSIGDLDVPPTAAVLNNYVFNGFTLFLETNNTTNPQLPEGVCGGDGLFGLFPPSDISDGNGKIYNALNGIVNSNTGGNMGDENSGIWFENGRYYCYNADDFGVEIDLSPSYAFYGFKTGSTHSLQIPLGGMPTGHWLLKSGSSTLAEFDLEVSSPVDNLGNFIIPLPVLRVNHANDGSIGSITVAWYLYDADSDQYRQLSQSQLAGINTLVRDSFIEMHDDDGPDPQNPVTVYNDEGVNYSENLITSFSLSSQSKTWYFPGSAGDVDGNLVPTFIKIGMHIAGLEYQFGWNN